MDCLSFRDHSGPQRATFNASLLDESTTYHVPSLPLVARVCKIVIGSRRLSVCRFPVSPPLPPSVQSICKNQNERFVLPSPSCLVFPERLVPPVPLPAGINRHYYARIQKKIYSVERQTPGTSGSVPLVGFSLNKGPVQARLCVVCVVCLVAFRDAMERAGLLFFFLTR